MAWKRRTTSFRSNAWYFLEEPIRRAKEKTAKRGSSTTFVVMDALALKALSPALQLHPRLLVLIEELRRTQAVRSRSGDSRSQVLRLVGGVVCGSFVDGHGGTSVAEELKLSFMFNVDPSIVAFCRKPRYTQRWLDGHLLGRLPVRGKVIKPI